MAEKDISCENADVIPFFQDQNIQESAVKIELLQKRMESGKKQADSAAELDVEVAKLREQEKEFEQTIAQLQRDLDSLERENAKLKQAVPAEKSSKFICKNVRFLGMIKLMCHE